MQNLHGYGQLRIPGEKPGPDRVVTLDAMRDKRDDGSAPGIHLKISDVVISGSFELDVTLTATQSANLGRQLCQLAEESQAAAQPG